jgi:hypothetical protein
MAYPKNKSERANTLKGFKALYEDVCNIDLMDINYYFSNEKFGMLRLIKNLNNKGLIHGIGRLFGRFLINCNLRGVGLYRPPEEKIFMFVGTDNQYKVIYPVHELLEGSEIIGVNYKNRNIKYHYPGFYTLLISILFLPNLIRRYKRASGYQKQGLKVGFDCFYSTYGTYVIHCLFLKRYKPRLVVVGNDHVFFYRSLLYAARKLSIPVCYIQHASISKNFPKLTFDISLLYGLETWEKYAKSRVAGEAYLIGDTSFKKFESCINDRDIVIGICVNKLDSYERISRLIIELAKNYNSKAIVLRPHPGDVRYKQWFRIAKKYNVKFSKSKIETSNNYLCRVSHIISGNSGILLEAARNKVMPILWLDDDVDDYYGYTDNGVALRCSTISEILDMLNRNESIFSNDINWYYSDVGTKWEGKSAELASKIIECKINHYETMDHFSKYKDTNCFVLKI